jgi:hypothetical protein
MRDPLQEIFASLVSLKQSIDREFSNKGIILTRLQTLIAALENLQRHDGYEAYFVYTRDTIYHLKKLFSLLKNGLFGAKAMMFEDEVMKTIGIHSTLHAITRDESMLRQCFTKEKAA